MKARKEEEARRREAELLHARKAYFEERKQAAARLQQLYTPSPSNQVVTTARCGGGGGGGRGRGTGMEATEKGHSRELRHDEIARRVRATTLSAEVASTRLPLDKRSKVGLF
jgi:hypothetical protein